MERGMADELTTDRSQSSNRDDVYRGKKISNAGLSGSMFSSRKTSLYNKGEKRWLLWSDPLMSISSCLSFHIYSLLLYTFHCTYIFVLFFLHVSSFDSFDFSFHTLPGEILKNHQSLDHRLLTRKQSRLQFPTKAKKHLLVVVRLLTAHPPVPLKTNRFHSLPPALVWAISWMVSVDWCPLSLG